MKRNLLILFLLAFSATAAFGQSAQVVTFRFVPGQDMFYIPWNGNDVELNRLYALVDEYRDQIAAGHMPVYVEGYCSAAGSLEGNLRTAAVRSNRVKSELITHKGLVEDNFITKNRATPYAAPDGKSYHNMVVVTLRIPTEAEPQQELDVMELDMPYMLIEEEEPAARETESVESIAEALAGSMGDVWLGKPYTIAVRTNLLYDAFLLPNLGLEWRIDRNVGVQVNYGGSYWGGQHGKVQKLWLLSPEVRWYLCDAKRLYVGASGSIGEYNIYKAFHGLSGDIGYQGKLWGAGLTVGYQLYLSRSFSLDFNLGLGYTRLEYDSFNMISETRVYREKDKNKNFWGPTQAGVSLVWTIGGNK